MYHAFFHDTYFYLFFLIRSPGRLLLGPINGLAEIRIGKMAELHFLVIADVLELLSLVSEGFHHFLQSGNPVGKICGGCDAIKEQPTNL